ncbi:MAG: hypothetical protein KBB01_02665 [Candidatus Omnitrophica bacterium]|jgi:hypothetical protein|nr:hypothetical protein [Candidatus Omnitrophota bacterium]
MGGKELSSSYSILNKRIRAFANGYRQNIALLGDNREELTYFLENYFSSNKLDTLTYIHTTTIYAGKQEFFRGIIFSLLNSYLHQNLSFDNLINYANSILPSTTEFIKNYLKKEDISFLDTLEVINKFINETNRQVIFIIEEFLTAADIFEDFYQSFSKFIILQRNCMIVLTTSEAKKAKKVLTSELNLLFGNFEITSINEKSFLEIFLYFKDLLTPFKPSPFFISFFINMLGSNIIYYNLIAKNLKNIYSNETNEEKIIFSALKDMFYSKESYFFQKFIHYIDSLYDNFNDFPSIIRLLFAISEGYLRKKDLISLGIYNSKDISHKLQKLCEFNFIDNLGNIYKLKDPSFSFWLNTVFKLYFAPPILNIEQKEITYRKKIEEEILMFKEDFFQNKLQRVVQLFSSFKNDSLRLDKNLYQLPYIEKTKIISYPNKEFHLIIGEGREIVFAGIKEKNSDDNDIFEFIEKGANIKGKKVRKIFVSLGILPPTAHLIAKNNRLTLWDLNDINRLLQIYNKPLINADLT